VVRLLRSDCNKGHRHRGRLSVLRALILAAAVAAYGLVLPGSGAAVAEPLPTVPVRAGALPTWQTNGPVWALESANGVVYAVGEFTSVRPPGAAAGSGEVPRSNFAAFDASTGDLLDCAPAIERPDGAVLVRALEASPDGSRLYVGGLFSRFAGAHVSGLAALDTATCQALSSPQFVRPWVASTVRAISATADRVYIGGDFVTVNSQDRQRFAILSPTGELLDSSAAFDARVQALSAAADFGKVLVGGAFSTVSGEANRGLVAVSSATGALVQSFPGWIPRNSTVKAIVRDAESFYVAGEGNGLGVFDGRLSGDLATGAMRWKDTCLGATQTLVVSQGVLFSGSHAHDCAETPGGWVEDGGRQHLLAQSTGDATILPWMPDTNDGIGPDAQGPRAMVMAGDQLWLGGQFTYVNSRAQRGLTRFGPTTNVEVSAPRPAASSVSPGKVRVSWLARVDRDDQDLTYRLYRDGTLIHSRTARSTRFNQPTMSFLDTVPPGQTVSYRIQVVEPDGEYASQQSTATQITAAAAASPYRHAVLSDGPTFYWPLDETVSQSALTRYGDPYLRARMWDAAGGDLQGTADGGYTLGRPGAIEDQSGSSLGLDGVSGRVASSYFNDPAPAVQGPQQYSVEMWFNTSTARGGKLIGFGNRRTESWDRLPGSGSRQGIGPDGEYIDTYPQLISQISTQYDRHVYMNNAGNVLFGNSADGVPSTVKSPGSYNDGRWHHMVATLGADGMRLYIDGELVGSNANTQAQTYSGYWRVGQDNLDGWPDKPSSRAFNGLVDEVAVYPRPLTAERVAAHFQPTADVPPAAPGGVEAVPGVDSVALSWDAVAGATGYVVLRDGVEVGGSADPAFVDEGLQADTEYEYSVSATSYQGTGPATVLVVRTLIDYGWSVLRLAGQDRYLTAVAVSQDSFDPGVSAVYVASGENFPDALSAGPAAGRSGGPLLLVRRDSVPAGVLAELRRLDPDQIVVVGGSAVVSASVESQLRAVAPTVRLAGANRYATSAAVAAASHPGGADVAYLATGTLYADALSAGPVAARRGAPLLLTSPVGLSPETAAELRRLGVDSVVITGGTGAVSSSVEQNLRAQGYAVARAAGADRYATAAALSRSVFVDRSVETVFLATGLNFPDALGAGAAAAVRGVPLLLTGGGCMPSVTLNELSSLGPSTVRVSGGTAVVSEAAARGSTC
jgi:putative cell wall-binding protein